MRYLTLDDELTLLSAKDDPVWMIRRRFGSVLETFVYGELLKHSSTAEGDYRLLYYRDIDVFEVDVVIENASGHLIGVEDIAAGKFTEIKDPKNIWASIL